MFDFKKMSFGKKLLVFTGCLCVLNLIGIGVMIAHGMSSGLIEEFVSQYGFLFGDSEYLSWDDQQEKVIKEMTKKLEKEPDNARAYAKRAKAYYWLSKYEKAGKDINRAIALNSSKSDWFSLRSQVRRQQDNEEGALKDLNRAIKLSHKNGQLYLERASLYEYMGELDSAIKDYSQAIKYSKTKNYLRAKRAEFYKRIGKIDKAIEDLDIVIEKANGSTWEDAIQERISIYSKSKDYQKALRDCGLWIDKEPDSNSAYETRAEIYESMKEKELAKKDYVRAIKIVTEEIKSENRSGYDYSTRAEYYEKIGSHEKAQEDYKSAFADYLSSDEIDGYDFESAMDLTKTIEDKTFVKENLVSYADRISALIKDDADNPVLYKNLGYVLDKLGKKGAAKSNWKNAIERASKKDVDTKLSDSDLDDLYQELGDKAAIKKAAKKTIERMMKAGKLRSKGADYYHDLGMAYQRYEDYESASKSFSKAIKLKPDSDHYLWHRADVSIDAKKYDLALRDLREAVSMDPKDASYYESLAQVLELTGKHKEAIEHATKAITLSPDSGKAYFWRGKARQSLKQYERSLYDLKKSKILEYEGKISG